jgi:hypothetical protein
MVMHPLIKWALRGIETKGSDWGPVSWTEGPRKEGHCCYCKGQCAGATPNCEQRVWDESASARKREW